MSESTSKSPTHTPNTKTRWLVFTDLDGTLLDHHNYNFTAAIPSLRALEWLQIPVIANTSKTFAEMLELRAKLNNKHPFITENGAAIYIPENYFSLQPQDTHKIEVNGQRFWLHINGKPRSHWQAVLSSQKTYYGDQYQSFAELGDEGVQSATGLSPTDAALANTREASEPILWHGSPKQKQQFIQSLIAADAQVLQGGRFLHLLDKQSSKGRAMQWLVELYARQYQTPVKTIAAGDSENDLSMLEYADIAAVIRREDGSILDIPARTSHSKPHYTRHYQSELPGPEGWAQILQMLIEKHLN